MGKLEQQHIGKFIALGNMEQDYDRYNTTFSIELGLEAWPTSAESPQNEKKYINDGWIGLQIVLNVIQYI